MDNLLRGESRSINRALLSLIVMIIFGGIAQMTPTFGWVIWLLGVALAVTLWSHSATPRSECHEEVSLDSAAKLVLWCAIVVDLNIALSLIYTFVTYKTTATVFGVGSLTLAAWVLAHDLILRHYYRLYCRKDVPYFTYTDLTMVSHVKRLINTQR